MGDAEEEEEEEFSLPKRRRLDDPPPLNIPRNILTNTLLLQSMARCGTDNADMVDHLTIIIKLSGGNPNDYFLSPDNVRKQKSKKLKAAAEQNRNDWVSPSWPILCWDKKKIKQHGKTDN